MEDSLGDLRLVRPVASDLKALVYICWLLIGD